MVLVPIVVTAVTIINTAAQVTSTVKSSSLSQFNPLSSTTESIITTTATPSIITSVVTSPTEATTSPTVETTTSSSSTTEAITTSPTTSTTSEATATDSAVITPTNGCPNLNFEFKGQGKYYPPAQGEVVDAVKVGANQYEISYKFEADNCPPISNLDQAKLIGIDSPDSSSYILYDSNSDIKSIDNSCDWTKTFVVNGQQTGSQICIPSFQIHYAWFSGKAANDKSSAWKYNNAYEYSVGCAHDNNNNSQNDLPLYCWDAEETTKPIISTESSATVSSEVTTSMITSTAENLAGPYDQCGGQNFVGATKCIENWMCQSQNDYYYQCVESTTTSTTSSTSSSTSSLVTTPVTTPTTTKKTTTQKTTTQKTTTKKTTTKKTTTKKTTTPKTTTPKTTTPKTTTVPTTTTPTTTKTTTATPTPTTTQFVAPYGQCGGINYSGATQCVDHWSCQSQNDYYYQCVTAPLAATETACGLMWAQCGGIGFNGYTDCCGGAVCVTQNAWYAQCTTTYKLI